MSTPTVLLIDDNVDDVYMLRLALLRANLDCDLRHVEDGREGIDYLRGFSHYSDRETFPFPLVTIVDTHLPYKSGLDVLTWIRNHKQLKDHPVVLLSGASHDLEEARARQLGANAYFEKTADYRNVVTFLSTMLPQRRRAEAA